MKKTAWVGLAFLLIGPAALAIDIQAVSEGVWAAVQPAHRASNDSNSLIVEGDTGVLVVDSQESSADVKEIIRFIGTQIGKPVVYLVNTHWHGDHTQGNHLYRQAYGDTLTIIGHSTHREDVPNRAEKRIREQVASLQAELPAAWQRLEQGIKRDGTAMTDQEKQTFRDELHRYTAWVEEHQGFTFTLADHFLDSPLAIEEAGFNVEILPVSGHTRGDLLVYLPKQEIIASGDMLDTLPYAGHGYPRKWLVNLQSFDSRAVSVWLPGHGEIARDRLLLENVRFYLNNLVEQVSLYLDEPMHVIQQKVDLSASRQRLTGGDAGRQRFFDQVQKEAVERAYLELTESASH
ncbi:MBL fold metallo-hydrolase [Bowmanella dokdonensis]|uniref:MBL fold metallo-hydrolase n=1 Tax=Bowmanella dokdonensis TaxID=751969 RepID=A0A939DPK8_9ALTE|nr:MBL fold metallo-hydrolase [Bowmanella dokdonensis]MBN7826624.1 MBL fold metallo-hydrolase [Bowmanella dokdonensis]